MVVTRYALCIGYNYIRSAVSCKYCTWYIVLWRSQLYSAELCWLLTTLDMYEVPGKKIVHQGINYTFEFACEYFEIFVGSDIISDADDITFLLCDFLLYWMPLYWECFLRIFFKSVWSSYDTKDQESEADVLKRQSRAGKPWKRLEHTWKPKAVGPQKAVRLCTLALLLQL